jgi:hypothetical protein
MADPTLRSAHEFPAQRQGSKMKKIFRVVVLLLMCLLMFAPLNAQHRNSSRPYYGGGKHDKSHGGHYQGQRNSHHRGGHYKNPQSHDRYGKHKP